MSRGLGAGVWAESSAPSNRPTTRTIPTGAQNLAPGILLLLCFVREIINDHVQDRTPARNCFSAATTVSRDGRDQRFRETRSALRADRIHRPAICRIWRDRAGWQVLIQECSRR